MSLIRQVLRGEMFGPDEEAVDSGESEQQTVESDRPTVDELLESGATSKVDVATETGLTPAEFLRAVVHTNGGKMYQKELVDATGWSESSVSRLLGALEAEGRINRVQVGREKIVYLDGAVPEQLTSTRRTR